MDTIALFTDISTNLDIISQNLQQFNFHLGEGFKIFTKCLHVLNEELCSKVRLNFQDLISCSQRFMKGKMFFYFI